MTAEETPVAWPNTVALTDLRTCTTCSVQIYAPNPGTLQILSRRQGTGQGDGVNIEESNDVGADYRGQRYSLEEAIFHVPGLHTFPGQTAPYPAEYHIHMRTYTQPIRYITIVFPVSHLVTGAEFVGSNYFAATASLLNPSNVASNPTLATLFTPGTQMIQYQGPDIRGRTAASPEPLDPSSTAERQFLLMLQPLQIRASDLERIPREGSLSINPVDLPAPGVAPSATILRNRMISYAVLATPGVPFGSLLSNGESGPIDPSANPIELECKPLKVINGKDYVINTSTTSSVTAKKQMFGAGPSIVSSLVPGVDWGDFGFHCAAVFFSVLFLLNVFYFIFSAIFDKEGTGYKRTLLVQSLLLIPTVIVVLCFSTYTWPDSDSQDNSS